MKHESTDILLKMDKLTVGYDKKPIIRDIELNVEAGKVLTLIGPNGSGKSTILKSITKQLQPLGGCVYLAQQPMHNMKDAEIAKVLSMVTTQRLKPELMTCRDVVATGRYPYTGRFGILSKEDWAIVDQSMELVHATETANLQFAKMSDGQKQRVMLARAICQQPQVLVLDEPTSYLDMRYKLDILQNIRNMAREKNLAIIMSLHELDLAQKISDEIACIHGDCVERVGTPETIFADDYIQNLYEIRPNCFDPLTGSIYLEGNCDTPQVFVIGGAGSAIYIYHRLQRRNIPFAAGILAENDVEYATAVATASEIVSCKAFYPIKEAQVKRAKAIMDQCTSCICSLQSFGPYNKENEQLLQYAKEQGKLVTIDEIK